VNRMLVLVLVVLWVDVLWLGNGWLDHQLLSLRVNMGWDVGAIINGHHARVPVLPRSRGLLKGITSVAARHRCLSKL